MSAAILLIGGLSVLEIGAGDRAPSLAVAKVVEKFITIGVGKPIDAASSQSHADYLAHREFVPHAAGVLSRRKSST